MKTHLGRATLCIMLLVLVMPCALVTADATEQNKNLAVQYSEAQGFSKNQVLDVVITDNRIMKISIDECSFCGAFKNEDTRNRIALSTLEWFLTTTGSQAGTVEWYNRSQVKIMTITGSRDQSEITSGLPCAIKKE